ncbi:hypothetical protein DSO57_1019600 [Entomophthora muscae]|uniref:Uncharacterized protein n=1 Tax=Entomophthora muscae TaxID=34485 RepID=A0ACC2T409_9FUNG|nr:hypothetical protein DSO57_1019600 [Entomophthora muscae]
MPANLGVSPTVSKSETFVTSQCPEFYTKDSLILSQCIFWKFHKTLFEDLLVVNHKFYVDLGGDSPPSVDCLLLSNNFPHKFLLHNDGPDAKDMIICNTTYKNLEQLRATETWLCDG